MILCRCCTDVDTKDELHTAEISNPILLTAWVSGNANLVQEFPTFYGTRRFITVLTTARHLSLSSAIQHQLLPFHFYFSLRFTLIFFCFSLRCLQTCFVSPDAHSTNPHPLFFQLPPPPPLTPHATSSSRRLLKR
jgi:hypothetical protein